MNDTELFIKSSNGLAGRYAADIGFLQELVKRNDQKKAFEILSFLVRMAEGFGTLSATDNPTKYLKTEDGHKFLVDFAEKDQAMSEINQDLVIRKEYEPETTKLIKSVVKLGDTVVDVGASIGHFTLLLAKAVGPEGKVFAIEPTKNQFPYLLENVKNNGYTNVEALNIGASDVNETLDLQVNAGSRFPLECKMLDDILPERVDFIKIDIDGSEPRALKGLMKTFERNPQLKMVVEYYPKYIERLGNSPQDMLDILDKYFTYEKIANDYGDGYWNYICTRK